jgi:hypothetical protein
MKGPQLGGSNDAALSLGSGSGKGGEAAIGIDTILLIDDPDDPVDDILAEISGGGFLGGAFVEVSLTNDHDGHASELTTCPTDETTGEALVSGSGVTDWFCCIGAGKWDNEVPPGKRACPAGEYIARILDVTAPQSTNMIWDDAGSELEASTYLDLPRPTS